MVHKITEVFERLKIPVGLVTGKQTAEERDEMKIAFQSGKLNALCLTLASGNAGLDLWKGRSAIFVNNDFKLGWKENAMDRCHRSGSEIYSQVDYYDLSITNSIDMTINKALKDKADMSRAIYNYMHEQFLTMKGN
jgi:SNF2 family DNA or RNA helicase